MENNMKASGEIIKCMEKVSSNGLMEEFTEANIMKIKNMVLEEFNGQTAEFTKANGEKVFKTEKGK